MIENVVRQLEVRAESTATVSSIHVSRADMQRIRSQGWPLPYSVTDDRIWLSLKPDQPLSDFVRQVHALGFSKQFAALVRWVLDMGKCCLIIDEHVDLNDRLLIFVG
jgi:hypothetical protein